MRYWFQRSGGRDEIVVHGERRSSSLLEEGW